MNDMTELCGAKASVYHDAFRDLREGLSCAEQESAELILESVGLSRRFFW